MQEWFCYIQSAFRLALQTSRDNWVSASELFPQHKGFQELSGRRGRAHTSSYRCPVFTRESILVALVAATDSHLRPRDHGGAARPSHSPECGHSPARSSMGQPWTPAVHRLCSQPRDQGLGRQASTRRAHSEWRRPGPPRSCNAPLALEDTTVPGQKQTLGLHGHSPGDGNSGPLLGSGDRQTSAGCGSHQRQEGQAEGQLCHLHVQVTKQEHSAAA